MFADRVLVSFTTLLQDAPGAPAQETQHIRTVWEYIAAGREVGAILIMLSITALTLVIINFWQLRLPFLARPTAVLALEQRLRDADVDGAAAICRAPEYECFLTRIFGSALVRCTRSPFGFLEIRTALEDSGAREVDRLSRVNDFIGIIAAIGPMLGLLGTVFGMIGAFSSIGDLEGAARSRALASYMSLALVNTAEGLAVAIPATVLFTIFKRRIERLAGEVADIIDNLALYLEHKAGTEKPAKPAPRPAPRPTPAAAGGAP